MAKGMNQGTLGWILTDTLINRLVDPAQVPSLIGELYRNAAYRPWQEWVVGNNRAYRKV